MAPTTSSSRFQSTDGYDVIETVAAQPWALNHKVGMVGLSYPGISQLFVAATEPPSLAAITPLSVYDDTARGVLAPGGIFNEGFALAWGVNVLDDAKPYGQGWERKVVESGDEMCKANQLLRGQNVDTVAKAKDSPYYDPKIADPLNPSLFVDRIKVPVFLTGAFQDEQTGGRFPLLFNRFTNAPVTRFSAWNGAHADGFQPANLVEWKTFLDFYVRGELTERPLAAELFLPRSRRRPSASRWHSRHRGCSTSTQPLRPRGLPMSRNPESGSDWNREQVTRISRARLWPHGTSRSTSGHSRRPPLWRCISRATVR